MGNCFNKGRPSRREQRLSAGANHGTGASGPAQQATPDPSVSAVSGSNQQPVPSSFPGAGSAIDQSSQQNQSVSSQDSIANIVKRLEADPKDVTKFKDILAFIDQALEKHLKHSRFEMEIPELISGNLEDADMTLKVIYDVCKEKDGKASAGIELQTILSDAFGGLANLHWITAAFSMVAFVLKRIDSTKENKDSCLDILVKIRKLGDHLVDLFEVIRSESHKRKLWQAGATIVAAVTFCAKELGASYFKRFTLANVRMGDISKFNREIPHLYQELTLIVVKETREETLGRTAVPLPSYKPEDTYIVGRKEIIAEVLETLRLVPQTYQAILLHGIGGIGKTTLGDKIVTEYGSQFKKSIAKVELGDNPGIEKICSCQKVIIERLGGFKREIGDVSEGRQFLLDYFKERRSPILLFVDNVFHEQDLDDLLPRNLFSVLPEGSYMLVTSRYATVSNSLHGSNVHWKEFPIDGLKKSDAEDLLENRLGGPCPESRQKQFHEILSICSGWPLAIEVVSSHLGRFKEDENMWNLTITKLLTCTSVSNSSQDRLAMILEWSYDQVDEDCKNIFLDVSCLLRGAEWSWAEALGTGSELKALEARSLLNPVKKTGRGRTTFSDVYGRDLDIVRLHDLFFALGQRKDKQSRNRVTRICSRDGTLPSVLEESDYEEECKHIQGLVLRGLGLDELVLPAKKLDAMSKSLRILHLGTSTRVEGEVQNMPKKLQICSLVGACPYKSLEGMNDLRVLHIGAISCNIIIDQILPTTLQILDLSGIDSLKRFHDDAFRNCGFLHTVHIRNCRNLQELPAKVFDSCSLRVLDLQGNKKLTSLSPGLMGMARLEDFQCDSRLKEFPSWIAGLKNLRTVGLSGFKGAPESVNLLHLSQLKTLRLNFGNVRTKTGPWLPIHGLGDLGALETLSIEHWGSLTQFCDDFSSKLTALKELYFKRCATLTQLPGGFQNLPALSKLDLTECSGLESLPDSILHLSSLKKLVLRGCKSLVELPEGFHKLLALSELDLRNCTGLQSLPNAFPQLVSLKKLKLRGCTSLRELPQEFGNLIRLSMLLMAGTDNLEKFQDGFPELVSLQTLESPARLFASKGFSSVKSLKKLTMTASKTLTEFPVGFTNLTSLKDLTVEQCESLTEVPSEIENLVKLQSLVFTGCKSLGGLPNGVGNLLALEHLQLKECENLRRMPNSICRLKNLRRLQVEGSICIEKLPKHIGDLSALQHLTLSDCPKLKALPHGVGSLFDLRHLRILGCESLRQLPDSVFGLKNLRTLGLGEGLEKFVDSFGDLSALEELDLSRCRTPEALPKCLTNLKNLRRLTLLDVPELRDHEVAKQLKAQNGLRVVFQKGPAC